MFHVCQCLYGDSISLLQHEKSLKAGVEKLRAEKDRRLNLLSQLRLEERALCDCLGVTPVMSAFSPSQIPTSDQLNEFSKVVAHLKVKKVSVLLFTGDVMPVNLLLC